MAPYIAHLILQLTVCMLLIFQLTFNISHCKLFVECVVAILTCIETMGLREVVVFNDLLKFL